MFTDPVKNLSAFGFRENMIVADLGAGTGFYTLAVARMVPQGKVYAVEVVKDYLDTINNKVKDERLTNVECFWGDVEKLGGTKIADGVVDAVIASNILFQVEDKQNFILEIKRILKPNGRVLLIDWTAEESHPVMKSGSAVAESLARELFESQGFKYERDVDTGDHHYGIIFIK